jgi:hypothetical protein
MKCNQLDASQTAPAVACPPQRGLSNQNKPTDSRRKKRKQNTSSTNRQPPAAANQRNEKPEGSVAELDKLRAEFEAERLAFREEQREWEQRRTDMENELIRRSEELDERCADLDARSAELAQCSGADSRSESTKVRYSPPPASSEQPEELVNYIEEHIARLLDRPTDEAPTQREPTASSYDRPAPSEPVVITPIASRAAVKLPPPVQPPETRTTLQNLRELAVASADMAIRSSERRRLLTAMGDKLMVALVGLIAGACLFWVWGTPYNTLASCSAFVAFVVAVYWGMEFLVRAKRFLFPRRRS